MCSSPIFRKSLSCQAVAETSHTHPHRRRQKTVAKKAPRSNRGILIDMAELNSRSSRRRSSASSTFFALLSAALCAVVFPMTGCPGAGGQCAINDDCAAGELCLDSVCSATCDGDSDCAGGESCSNGVCVSGEDPEPTPGPSEPDVGEPDPLTDGGDVEPDITPTDGGEPEPPVDSGEPDGGEPEPPGPEGPDGGEPEDAGPGGPDGGPGGPDGGPNDLDGGPTGPDGGDADGGTPSPDPTPEDAGVDGGPPPPAPPSITSLTAFSTRVTNAAVDSFVFDIEGVDVNSDPAQIYISVFNDNDDPLITDFLLSVNANGFDVDGTSFSIRVFVSGFAGLPGGPAARAQLRVVDATGLSAATGTDVNLPGPPQTGGTCPIPDQQSFIPCPATNVCVGTGDVGTCATVNTANPTLNPVPDLTRQASDPNCQNAEFPDGLSFVLTGTSEQRVVTVTLDGANNLTLNNPSTPPNFNITGTVCARADAAGTVSFTVTDESGRVSNAAAGNIPPP